VHLTFVAINEKINDFVSFLIPIKSAVSLPHPVQQIG
jgi:hypothetical protein